MGCKAQIGLSCVFLDDHTDDCRSEMTPKSERKTGVDGVETVTMDVTSDSTMVASGDGGADEGGVVEEMDSGDWGSPGPPENNREVPPPPAHQKTSECGRAHPLNVMYDRTGAQGDRSGTSSASAASQESGGPIEGSTDGRRMCVEC